MSLHELTPAEFEEVEPLVRNLVADGWIREPYEIAGAIWVREAGCSCRQGTIKVWDYDQKGGAKSFRLRLGQCPVGDCGKVWIRSFLWEKKE